MDMNLLKEWLNLILRWIHVIAGIMWIGQTYLFSWMERVMTPASGPGKENISGELWMVHGGGFFLVEKQKWPERTPKTLHWFKWESFFTWLSGVCLLAVVYWSGAPLLEYGSAVTRGQGIAVSVAVMALGWVGYNLLLKTPLFDSEALGAAVGLIMTTAVAWALGSVFSDRAVYIHIGVMFGTIMVSNVWMVIIPNQKKIMKIMEAGGAPNLALSAEAKRRSKHNTYMGVPLIFTMISNHFPDATFGRPHAWLILAVLIVVGWLMAKVIRDLL